MRALRIAAGLAAALVLAVGGRYAVLTVPQLFAASAPAFDAGAGAAVWSPSASDAAAQPTPIITSAPQAAAAPSAAYGVSQDVPPALLTSPRDVLRMALDAPRLIDYEGTKVVTALRNGRTDTVTVAESHKRPNVLRLEYLSPEEVAGRLIVDNGTTAWHYEPKLNMVFEDRSVQGAPLVRSGDPGRDLTLLLRNYRLTLLGTDEVIGHQAYVLALEPKAPGIRRTLWVDRVTGMVLRTEDRDPSRGVVLTTYFTRISFSLNLPEAYFAFRPPAGARIIPLRTLDQGSLSPAALAQQVRFPVLIPPVLPEGYTFRGGAVTRFGSLTSVYLKYSDGGSAISFFEAPAGSIGWPAFGQQVQVQAQPGRFIDLGYFRVLIWEQRGLRLTAVGTAPTETLLLVAGQIAAGREQALVTDVARRAAVDPATVHRLRGDGLTFPEITRTVAVSRALGTDLPTTVRFVRGGLTVNELAQQLGMRPEVLRQSVALAVERASEDTPVMLPAVPRANPAHSTE